MDEKERYLRWMETMWELHKGTTREEERKEEVLRMLRGLGRLSEKLGVAEAPRFPPWEPPR